MLKNALTAKSRLVLWLHGLFHHFVVALTVASVVGLLHHSGQLEWLDSAMLRIAGSYNSSSRPTQTPDPGSPDVLLISGPLYERVFELRSPLDRSKVAPLVSAIASHGGGVPATVVFDLDFSATGHDTEGQTVLDQQLKSLVEGGVLLVLPLPSVAHTPEVASAIALWMKKACAWRSLPPKLSGRVVFASPTLRSHGGRVLQYSTSDLSLGIAATRPMESDDVCTRSLPELQLLVQFSTAEQTRNLTYAAPLFPKARPLNAKFFLGLQHHVHELASIGALPLAADGKPLPLAGRVVFVGGSYDPRDRFETALELDGQATEGVTLHAAVYYSAMNPISVEQGFGALSLDIVLGILMGYMFTAAWGWHAAIQTGRGWKRYLVPKLVFVGILAGAVLLASFLVWAAANWLLPLNVWVSPGPVVLGLCAKLMLSRSAHSHSHDEPPASRWVRRAVIASLALANIAMIASHWE